MSTSASYDSSLRDQLVERIEKYPFDIFEQFTKEFNIKYVNTFQDVIGLNNNQYFILKLNHVPKISRWKTYLESKLFYVIASLEDTYEKFQDFEKIIAFL